MNYKSELRNIHICTSPETADITHTSSTDITRTIAGNIDGKHKIIINNLSGYDKTKDILISDGCNSYAINNNEVSHNVHSNIDCHNTRHTNSFSIIQEDIGLGADYKGHAAFIVYNPEDITNEYCEHIYARKMHTPAFILKTSRFIVREECENDLPELYSLYETLSDCDYIEPLYEYEREKKFINDYIDNMYYFFDYGLWLVFDKATGELVGRIGIENRSIDGRNCQELGYLVGKDYQRRHVAFEVCSAVIDYASEYLGIETLYACIHSSNIPSIRLIQKLGFYEYASNINGMNIYSRSI